jgi:1-deoxy-D-xylulose-5-phosphate synthase
VSGTLLLDRISRPEDLRGLGAEELDQLAAEIRRFVVQAVARTGGHLGSNLGVVEITLAVHRAFDSPRDTILWDTGHQAYVHKLVTGRRDGFERLRQVGGLSGYPSRAESDHDVIENSHASTALSYAHGLATARRHQRAAGADVGEVVVVVGAGALTGGLAYEALNNLGHGRERVTIILNDNGRSYAPTVSRLFGADGTLRAFVESLGVRYEGPVDGHDIGKLEAALRDAADADGPVLVHALTRKGRGYAPAEDDDEKCLHDVSTFDPDTGLANGSGGPTYTQAFTAALVAVAERRPEVVAITAAMPGPTGLIPFQERFPDRFVDVGIAEQHALTSAAGMALGGLRPVVAVYSTFLNRAWDQLYYDVGLHGLPVVLCLDRSGITGDDGPSHHGVLDLALLTKVPNLTVLAPSSYQEVAVMLETALGVTGGPIAIRWPKGAARQVPARCVGSGLRGRLVRRGTDVCLLAVGKLLEACEEAAAILEGHGVSSTVWDVRVVTPPDPHMLADAARHPLVITAEDGIADGGAGTFLAAALARGEQRPDQVVHLGVPTAYVAHGKPGAILVNLGLDGTGIAAAAVKALER